MSLPIRKYPPEQTWVMIRKWCDKAERAHQDVARKLIAWGVPPAERNELLTRLISEDLVNEERYATAFVHDHFTFRKWGIRKIEHALRAKGVSDRNIAAALRTVPSEAQEQLMESLVKAYLPKLRGLHPAARKAKLARHLIARGMTPDRVWPRVQQAVQGD